MPKRVIIVSVCESGARAIAQNRSQSEIVAILMVIADGRQAMLPVSRQSHNSCLVTLASVVEWKATRTNCLINAKWSVSDLPTGNNVTSHITEATLLATEL